MRVFEPNVLTTTLQRLSLGFQVQSYQERCRTTATREDNLQDTFEDSPYLFSIKRRMILHTGRTLHRYHAWVMQEVQYKGCLMLSLTDVSVVSSLCSRTVHYILHFIEIPYLRGGGRKTILLFLQPSHFIVHLLWSVWINMEKKSTTKKFPRLVSMEMAAIFDFRALTKVHLTSKPLLQMQWKFAHT